MLKMPVRTIVQKCLRKRKQLGKIVQPGIGIYPIPLFSCNSSKFLSAISLNHVFLQKNAMAFLVVALLAFSTIAHPIHLAVTEIAYSEKEKSLQVIHKIFVDDLELHIEEKAKSSGQEIRLHLNTPKEHPMTDALLQAYLSEHFQVKVNGKIGNSVFIGKEYENGAVWIYSEFPNLPKPRQLDIQDNLLIDLYDDQNNLVNLEIFGKTGSLRFRKGYIRDVVTF